MIRYYIGHPNSGLGLEASLVHVGVCQERLEVQREVGHLCPVYHQLELEALAEVAPGKVHIF